MPHQGNQTLEIPTLNFDSPLLPPVETFQSCHLSEALPVLFLSLIKYLCQNMELLLTEHKALCRVELVLTATSSHHIYTCTYSLTTSELIGVTWNHIM